MRTDQSDTSLLVAKSRLVILIVSTVLYEALNQNKKVAIYKKINYERYYSLNGLPNIHFFDEYFEVFDFLDIPLVGLNVNYFKPTNYTLLNKLIH